ncbi:MAG: YDG domain-containing protein [Rhodanobacteraceae bacterium]
MTGWRGLLRSLLWLSLAIAGVAHAGNAPTGGQIVAGSGHIQQSGNITTIRQNSQTLSLNWQNFDVGAAQTVQFLQPGANSIAVNRILGNTASKIDGHLKANGQVWLINPNGVLFGRNAQVNVGGLVASTLSVDDSTIGSDDVRFAGDGTGKVVNRGSITAAPGGYVALLGNQVSNQGVIRARLGTVALGAGTAVTLTFADHHLMHLQVDRNTIRSLAENRQLIVADGGSVLMTAGARDSLVASAVNNSGTLQARSVEEHDGTITLLAGMQAGTVRVGGILDASAPDGGDGGEIETSAAHFELASDARITAAAADGRAGTWLVDPVDLTIDSAAAATISNSLNGGTNVTEQTTATSASGVGNQSPGDGDINVNAAINWTNAAATLELDAYHAINVNAGVSGSGGIVMKATDGALTIGSGGSLSANGGATLIADTFVNNASSTALGTNWKLYTASPAGDVLGGITPDFIQYDSTLGSTLADSGNGLIYSIAPTLKIASLKGTASKVYDNTAAATFTGSNFNASGLLGGDQIASASGGSYASVDVGSGIAVTSPGAIADFVIKNNGAPVYGYALTGSSVVGNIGKITPRPLTATIVGNPTKIYDGTTTATLTSANYNLGGFVAGQGATVSQPSSIAYAGSDAGSQALNATFSVTNFTADSGTQLSNYMLPIDATGTGTITQAPLLISGLLADNKIYDGGTTDTIVTSGAKLFGVIAPDAGEVGLDTSGIVGSFAQSNAGSGIAVSVSGWSLTGTKASNYQIVAPSDLAANITPKTLTIDQVTASDKTYDATRTAPLDTDNAVLDGVIGTDDVVLDSIAAAAEFSQADVRNGLTVTTHGFTLDGTAKGNYVVTQPTLSADITPALLTVTMIGTPTKTYDGTDAVTLGASDFDIVGFIGTQHAVVFQSSAHYATANAGSSIDVTATLQPSDFTPDAGTSMSNYTFAPTVVGTGLGQIDALQLTGKIIGNPTKTYDGTTDAQLMASNVELEGMLPGDSISASFSGAVAGSYTDPNAGVHEVDAGALGTANFTAASGTLLGNYLLPVTYVGSGTITPAPLSGNVVVPRIDGSTRASKVYDGTMDITLQADNFTLSGWVAGDGATFKSGFSTTGHFGQSDVGTDLPLSATLDKFDLVADAGTNLANYAISSPAFGLGDITPRSLAVSIVNNPTKVYNGSVDAALTSANFQITGWATDEGGSIEPTATASYDAPDAGSRTVKATLTPGNYVLDSGTQLSNYDVAYSAIGPGTITRAPLFVTGVYATDKSYNATAADALDTDNIGLAGLVDSDVGKVALDLTGESAEFSQADAGSDLAVTATGFAITGSEASNYNLQAVTGLRASITPASLTLTGVSADDKPYDGNDSATLGVSGSAALAGIFGSDSVSFDASDASGHFSTANAGDNLKVTASGFTLTGAAAGNYALKQPTGLTANIDPKALTAVITGSPTKVYDGTDSATLTASDYDLQGFVAGQSASIPQSATANYVTRNVGTGLGVVSTLVTSDFVAAAGTNLANYVLPTSGAGSNGVIKPKVIDLTATRVYDGTATANASLFGTLAGVNSETLTVSGSGTLSSRNVGNERSFSSLGTLALVDGIGSASNYTLAGGTDWVTITPAPLEATFTAENKIYDGNDIATLTGAATLSGLIGSDAVTLVDATSAHFSDKNVGTGKSVTGDMSISGSDAGNYTFSQGTATADINALHVTVTATGKNKQYDATLADPGTTVQSTGVIMGDTVNFGFASATFADKNVANDKTVTVDGITAGGSDGGNYVVDNPDGVTTTADITPRIINLNGTRIYDGTTVANAGLFASGGDLATGFGSEHLTLTGSGTVDKNVGNGKTVTLASLVLGDGSSGGLASNYTLSGGTDKLTITQRPLTATFDADSKTYNADRAAVLENAALVDAGTSTTSGLIAGDLVSLTNSTVGKFDNKNVGTDKTVTGAMGITGDDASNYVFTNGTALADITQALLTVVATGSDKTYDGNTTAKVTLAGGIAGDDLIFSDTSADYDGKDAGAHNISVQGIAVGGADAGNYSLANNTATATGNIGQVVLDLTSNRIYDGTVDANASLFGAAGVLTGVDGETVRLSGTGHVADKNVGTAKAFADPGDLTLQDGTDGNGGLAQNYTLTGGTDTLTITPKSLTATATVNGRQYDGTTAVDLVGASLVGLLVGDNVALDDATEGTFANKNVGTAKAVTTNMTISGTDAANYAFTTLTGLTASVTPKPIDVSAVAKDKVYDADTAGIATLSSAGVLADDTVDFGYGTATFADANAATGKIVTVNGITKTGSDAGNYALNSTIVTTTADITPVVLNLAGTRIYDGTVDADASLFGTGGVLAGVGGETLQLSGTGHVADKNVARDANGDVTAKAFANRGTLALGDGSNGGLASNYTLAGGTDTLTITPRSLTVTTTPVDRDYDGTKAVALNGSTLSNVVSGDDVVLGNASQGLFANKNVGTGKAITTAMTVSGDDVGNYNLAQPTGLVADVDPLAITVKFTAANKIYDATTDATLTSLGSSGLLGGDTVNFGHGAASFADANVASGKMVTVSGITKSGTDADNYTINTTATATADITPVVLNLSGARVYDGTLDAGANLFGTGGVLTTGVAGQTLVLTGSGAVGDKNVDTNKAVSLGGLTLTDGTGGNGGLAQNYTLVGGTDTLTITPKSITVSAAAQNKVYDGGTADIATLGSSGVLTGDTLDFDYGTATFADANAATGKIVTVSGITKSGADVGNYTINTTATTTADITPFVLNLSGTRVYDGTTGADAGLFGTGGVLTTGIGSQTLVLTGSGTVGDKNVARDVNGDPAAKAISDLAGFTLSDGSNGGLASNYTLVDGSDTLTITPRSLTVTTTPVSRDYDGTKVVALTGSKLSNLVSGDDVMLGSATQGLFADKNAGTGKAITTAMTISGGDVGNYSFTQPTGLVANVDPLAITVDFTAANKIYDATTGATVTSLGSSGLLGGDTVNFTSAGATFGDANVADNKIVTVTGITKTGTDADNYTINMTATTKADITPVVLNLAGTRVYDGTTDADANLFGTGGVLAGIAGQTLNLSGGGHVADKNVGASKMFANLGSLTLQNGTDGNGGLAQNYTLVGGTDTLTITAKAITVSAVAQNKVYDGGTAGIATLASSDVLTGDTLDFDYGSATFTDANAATGKIVTVSGITKTGADAGNYTINTTATTAADITPFVLNLSGTRVYDSTADADATLFGDHGVLAGVASESLTLSGVGTLADKNVGTRKPFPSMAGFTLTGNGTTLASNYTLVGGSDWVTITPAALVVTGTKTTDHNYDGTRVDTLSGATLSGLLGNDEVTLGNAASGRFADANVGTDKTVTTAMTIDGKDSGNYVLQQPTGLVADITRRPVTVAATGTDKMFDGNTIDTVTLAGEGVVSGDDVGFSREAANFSDSNVDDDKTVTVTGIRLTGADAANYVLVDPVVTTTANITGAQLSAFGVDNGVLAYLQGPIRPASIATPYGLAIQHGEDPFTGNRKMLHRPIERHSTRRDFTSGMALKVVDGGVRMPVRSKP